MASRSPVPMPDALPPPVPCGFSEASSTSCFMLSTAGFTLAVYGCVAAWVANLLAALWGAGNSMLPFAAGSARGSALQEGVITVALRSAAIALIATTLLVLWGLRAFDGRREGQ